MARNSMRIDLGNSRELIKMAVRGGGVKWRPHREIVVARPWLNARRNGG